MKLTNNFLFTDHAIRDYFKPVTPTEPITTCSVCKKAVKVSEAVETYASEGHQNLRHKTPAHSHCAKSRAAEIANFRRAR